MPDIHARASALIEAPPATVYGIIADYHRGHPGILPPKYFGSLRVEEGGTGAGTRISFEMRSFGTVQRFRGEITEPEPGRRLVESYPDMGIETVFTVDPVDGGRRSRVTIATGYRKPGLRGWLERLLAPAFLRTVYTAELGLLAERAAGPGASSGQ
jgi:uncharacterized protein YndB with AHSA1/START domain